MFLALDPWNTYDRQPITEEDVERELLKPRSRGRCDGEVFEHLGAEVPASSVLPEPACSPGSSRVLSPRCSRDLIAVVVDLHPDRPDQRGFVTPSGTVMMLAEEPTPREMTDAGGRVDHHDEPHRLANGFFVVSGLIDRVTSYETGTETHVSFRGAVGRADPLILDERFVAAYVRGRGVSVLSACSHAGIVNVCLAAQRQFPGVPIDVVLGGYHLAGAAMEPRIPATVDDLDRLISPRVVAPAHCTGWRAAHALAERFSPGRFAPSVVGSRYALTAPPKATDSST